MSDPDTTFQCCVDGCGEDRVSSDGLIGVRIRKTQPILASSSGSFCLSDTGKQIVDDLQGLVFWASPEMEHVIVTDDINIRKLVKAFLISEKRPIQFVFGHVWDDDAEMIEELYFDENDPVTPCLLLVDSFCLDCTPYNDKKKKKKTGD